MTWSKKKLKGKIKKYREASENDNITYQNFWDAAKVVIKGEFISLQAYLKQQKISQINNIISHLKEVGEKRTNAMQSQQKKENNKN